MTTATGIARLRTSRARRRNPLRLTALAIAVGLIALSPVGYVVGQASSAGWGTTWQLVSNPATLGLLAHTFTLTGAVVGASTLVGGGSAWLLERTNLPARKLWAALLPLPIAVPAFVAAFAWISVLPAMAGFAGAFVVMTLANYPLVLLPAMAAFRSMDPALEEAASTLGCGPWQTFRRAVMPQAIPALLGGALLVALETLAEFGAFSMLNFSTFTTTIYDQYNLSFDGPTASMLAMVLVIACLILLVAELRLRGKHQHSRVGGGTPRTQRRHRLGWRAPLALGTCATVVTGALGVPASILVYWLIHGNTGKLPLESLTGTTLTTLGLSLAAAAATTILAIPVAILATRHRSRLATAIERGTYLSHGLPGVVVALALVFLSIHFLQPVYETTTVLVLGYAIVFLPLALIGVRTAIERVPAGVLDAARSLGVSPVRVFFRITLPLIAPGIGAATALVFLVTMTELTVTIMLAPPGLHTLAMMIWSDTNNLNYAAAAPYAAILVALSAVPTYLLTTRLGKAALS